MGIEAYKLRRVSLFANLGDGRRSATVTTTSPARLFVMFGTEFRQLQEAQPEVAAQLEAAMAERV
jgi:CRP-like cAMP-binding protein